VSVEHGLGHYQLDPRVAHLHQRHACPRTLHVSQMSSMKAQLHELQEEKRISNEWMATHDQMIAYLKRIIESVASNAAASNTLTE
jgi:hypothetical protein